MKKTIFILSLMLSFTIAFGQSWESLSDDLKSSNEDIEHDRKKTKARTWFDRAELLYEIHSFNTAGLNVGMAAEEGIVSVKTIMGEPEEIKKADDGTETWIYPRVKIYIAEGAVQDWEETEFIVEDAILKASDALFKADEVDDRDKWKHKNSFQMLAMQVRTAVVNKGVGYYQESELEPAYKYMTEGIRLNQLPKMENDTNYTEDVLQYYSGIIALGLEKTDKARKHFSKAIEMDYSPGISYHYLATTYEAEGNSDKYIETVKKGFEKYPNEEQLVIDLINYYIEQDEPDKVIEYIDLAIDKNPDNPSYYSAKATIYDNRDEKLYEKYVQLMDSVHEYKKKAFQNRFDAKKKAKFEKLQKEAEQKAEAKKEEAEKVFKKADDLYAKALEKDSSFFNAAFNRGRLYYKKHERKAAESDLIFKIYKDGDRADKVMAEVEPALRKSAEFFEMAHKANPKDISTVDILRSIYFKLRDKEKQQKYLEILSELNKNKAQSDEM
jgi:tetratricopeptide (TPR) repeat protein